MDTNNIITTTCVAGAIYLSVKSLEQLNNSLIIGASREQITLNSIVFSISFAAVINTLVLQWGKLN